MVFYLQPWVYNHSIPNPIPQGGHLELLILTLLKVGEKLQFSVYLQYKKCFCMFQTAYIRPKEELEAKSAPTSKVYHSLRPTKNAIRTKMAILS